MTQAILISINGTETKLSHTDLKILQTAVAGNIELVHTHRGEDMYINEDGKALGLGYNKKATLLYEYCLTDQILGNVVVMRKGK